MPIYRSLMGVSRGRVFTGALTAAGTIATSENPMGVCTSSDNKNVYVRGTAAIRMFSRDIATGSLTSLGDFGVADTGYPASICISADGTSVYTSKNGITICSRNTTTGVLTLAGTIASANLSNGISISADGKNVYGGVPYLLTYSRNTTTGMLTLLSTYYGSYAKKSVISADGKNVYALNGNADTFPMFSRDTTTGILTFISNMAVIYYNPKDSICKSPDDKNVYVISVGSLSMFSRNTTTGSLTLLANLGVGNYQGKDAVVSSDGKSLYVTNYNGAITRYNRDITTGMLTYISDTTITVESASISISADDTSVYATNSNYNALLSIFTRS